MSAVEQAVLDYLQSEFLLTTTLTTETALIESGIVDSLGIFRLVSFLEATFGIAFEPTDVNPDHFQDVQAIAAFVERKRTP